MQPKSILVVDDEASVRTSLEKVLNKEGYITTTASSGNEAIKMLARTDFISSIGTVYATTPRVFHPVLSFKGAVKVKSALSVGIPRGGGMNILLFLFLVSLYQRFVLKSGLS